MSREEQARVRNRARRARHEFRLAQPGSAAWARVMARQLMEVAIRRGVTPDVAARRAADVEAGLIDGQERIRARARCT
jgi:hypothetical protein